MKDKIVEILKESQTSFATCDAVADWNYEEVATAITQHYSAGEEVYVECDRIEATYIGYKYEHEFNKSVSPEKVLLKKLTRPTVSEEEIDIRKFLEGQDISKSYQTIYDKNWNEVSIESLLIAFKELLNQKR